MAVKDHSLDSKIIDAAMAEFMQHGFQKASVHKIAERAGLTTGALYTRYRNKDALFCSLIQDMFSEIAGNLEPMKEKYYSVQNSGDPRELMKVIRSEEKIYLDMLFEHYDQCVLFFCKSAGSSIEKTLGEYMHSKAQETVQYLKDISHADDVDLDGIELIMTQQFQFYRLILEHGYTKEKAVSCMKTVEDFMEAGWLSILEKIMQR